jgi:hypothetical protein
MSMRISWYLSILCGALLHAAVASAGEPPRSARIVTSSDDLQLSKADHAVCLDRRRNPHATMVRLPADAEPDQVFVVDDCSENARTFPVTIVPPEGHTISGWRILAGDGGSFRVRYFGDKTWRTE